MEWRIEVVSTGEVSPDVLDYLANERGLLIERVRPLVIRTVSPGRDMSAVLGAARLMPGVVRVTARPVEGRSDFAAGSLAGALPGVGGGDLTATGLDSGR